jgi:hypothetical protein
MTDIYDLDKNKKKRIYDYDDVISWQPRKIWHSSVSATWFACYHSINY